MKLRSILLLIIATGFTLSCQSYRKSIKQPLKEYGETYLINQLKSNELKFNTFSSRFTAYYSFNRDRGDIKGQIRLVRDSALWISLTKDPGIEVVRLLITPDSLKMLDRISKRYYAGNYTLVNDLLEINIDFEILQSLLLGNDFENYESMGFRASIDQKNYRLTTTGRRKSKKAVRNHHDQVRSLIHTIWLDPQTFKITEMKVRELTSGNKKLSARYSAFTAIDDQLFPTRSEFRIESQNTTRVIIKHSRVTLNEPLTMPFSIPDNYSN